MKRIFISLILTIFSFSTRAMAAAQINMSGLNGGAASTWESLVKNPTGCLYEVAGPGAINLRISLTDPTSFVTFQIVNPQYALPHPQAFTYNGVPINGSSTYPKNLTVFGLFGGHGAMAFVPLTSTSFCTVNLSLNGKILSGSFTCEGLASPQDSTLGSISVDAQNLECSLQ